MNITANAPASADRVIGGRFSHQLWFGGLLTVITLAALTLRLLWLWPPARSVVQAPYDDEGVYVMAAQLLWQGQLPYRDYFFAHPPLGIAAIAPALGVAFTPWGSALSFGIARLWMAVMSTATVPVIGLAAARVWGPVGGLVAAIVLTVDPASVANGRHVLLEVPMGLAISAALLAGTYRGGTASYASGLLAGLATLVKAQAGLLVVAFTLAALAGRRWRHAFLTLVGAATAFMLLVPTAAVVGPDTLVRQVVLFQLLRPADGLATVDERLTAILSPGGMLFGLICAIAGLLVAAAFGRVRVTDGWWPAALWVGLGLIGFLASRSYYPHYASQLMPGLALLAGGIGTMFPATEPADRTGDLNRAGGTMVRRRRTPPTLLVGAVAVAIVLLVVPPLAAAVSPRPDPIFETVARYLADATPPGGAALTTDAQFNVLASRALPRATGGYLVDSYGQLAYAGLGLDTGLLSDQARRLLAPRETATVDEVIWRPAAQALLREHLGLADVVVIHAVGQRRMTPGTRQWLSDNMRLAESTRRYDIFRRER